VKFFIFSSFMPGEGFGDVLPVPFFLMAFFMFFHAKENGCNHAFPESGVTGFNRPRPAQPCAPSAPPRFGAGQGEHQNLRLPNRFQTNQESDS
jgi:hypothetical protein